MLPSPLQNSNQPVDRSTILNGEISATFQSEFGALSSSQLEMDNMRPGEQKFFATAREDLKQGIPGVQQTLETRRNCYVASFVQQPPAPQSHQSSRGAGTSIIGTLQVTVTDFSMNFAVLFLPDNEVEAGY